jgi:uncharacterized membrane protein YdjX (TVP38/TMEM64 family)
MQISKSLPLIGLILLSSLVVIAIAGVVFYFGLESHINLLLIWVSKQGHWAWLMFIIIDCLVVVLLLPGLAFTLGAGFIFGFFQGFVIIVMGTTLGAILAFISARYFFSASLKTYLREHKRFSFFNRELISEGWKIIILSRLIPFFPFKLSNYFFGAAEYKFGHFLFGTLVGIVPITAFNVYLGSLVNDITHLISLDSIAESSLTVWLYGFGFFISIVLLNFVFHLAQKSLEKYSRS